MLDTDSCWHQEEVNSHLTFGSEILTNILREHSSVESSVICHQKPYFSSKIINDSYRKGTNSYKGLVMAGDRQRSASAGKLSLLKTDYRSYTSSWLVRLNTSTADWTSCVETDLQPVECQVCCRLPRKRNLHEFVGRWLWTTWQLRPRQAGHSTHNNKLITTQQRAINSIYLLQLQFSKQYSYSCARSPKLWVSNRSASTLEQ